MRLYEKDKRLSSDELYNGISNVLENYLHDLYKQNGIRTHDVTPEQYLKWDKVILSAVHLVNELYNDNLILTKSRYGRKNNTKKDISIKKD